VRRDGTDFTTLRLLALIGAIGIFQIATLRSGHAWGDDFAEYILQTVHMATGHGFVPYEFIPNPETQLGGQAYPPGTSVLLLPVYLIFGLNLTAMKIVGVLCVILALFFIDRLFENRLPPAWRLVLVALVGLNPTLFETRDSIESEKPFLLFLFLSLYLIERAYSGAPRRPPPWRLAFWVGGGIFAACATRNVGFALFPALLVLDLFSYRRLTAFAAASLAIAAAPALAVSRLLATSTGYKQFYNFSLRWILYSSYVFSKHAERVWWGGHPRAIAFAIGLVAGLLALWGLWLCLKQRPGAPEFLIPFYLGIILPYFAPWYYPYFIPLMPIYMCYMLMGLRDILRRVRSRPMRHAVVAAGTVVLFVLYGSDYRRANWEPFREGISDPEFIRLCDYVKSHTAPSDVVLFRKPRLLALLTGRPSSVYTMHLDRPTEPAEIWNWAQKIHAQYLIIPLVPDPDVNVLNHDLMRFISQYRDRVQLVYETEHFSMYRLISTSGAPA